MLKMTLILLSGNAGSGKSALSKHIVDKYKYTEFALGDKLKELTFSLLKVFNVDINDIGDLYDVRTKEKYRSYLQLIGTECCRNIFGEDFWCKIVDEQIEQLMEDNERVVISDVRFPNEEKYFKDKYKNVHHILIITEGNNLTEKERNHSSEKDVNSLHYDYKITNNKDEQFFVDVDKLMDVIESQTKKQLDELIQHDVFKFLYNYRSDGDRDDGSEDDVGENVGGRDEESGSNIQQPSPQPSTPTMETSTSASPTSTTSSYRLGQIGEKEVLRIIETIRPDYDTQLVSFTGHVADIHSTDYRHNIKYIFEIKHKQAITRDDVSKFEKDIEHIQKSEMNLKVIGIFVSLKADRIPSIGKLSITQNKIYLSRPYFSENILDLIFKLIETYNEFLTKPKKADVVKYEITPNVLNLLVKLRAEYASLSYEKDLFMKMKGNAEQILNTTQELFGKLILKEQFIKFINSEFSDVLPECAHDLISNDEEEMRKYIQTHRANVRKKDLLSLFPTMSSKISSTKLEDLKKEYG